MIQLAFKRIYILFLVVFFSCTKEDNADCTAGLILKYSYEHNKQGVDLFGPDVQYIKMYIFNEQNILHHIDSGKGTALTNGWFKQINLAPGKYSVVSWAGGNPDFHTSFFDSQMSDRASLDFSHKAVVGQTTLQDFRIIVNHQLAEMYEEDVILPMDSLDDLYYGTYKDNVEVKPGYLSVQEIPLIKNTNKLRVIVEGLQHLKTSTKAGDSDILEVYAAAKNGRYMYNNAIDEYARVIRYETPFTIVSDTAIETDIKILRLDIEHHTANPVTLYVNNKQTNLPLATINVVESILKAQDENGNYLINNQSDLDKEDLFVFKVQINTDLSVNIFVNGWNIKPTKPEI